MNKKMEMNLLCILLLCWGMSVAFLFFIVFRTKKSNKQNYLYKVRSYPSPSVDSEHSRTIYIGDYLSVQNARLLEAHKIRLIVNCAKECRTPELKELKTPIHYLRLNLEDSLTQDLLSGLDWAIQLIQQSLDNQGNVLVHCAAGISRSVSIVMAFLIHEQNLFSADEALSFVRTFRPQANPNLNFVRQLNYFAQKKKEKENQ